HANLQLVLETFSHTQQASKYSQSNGAETALTDIFTVQAEYRLTYPFSLGLGTSPPIINRPVLSVIVSRTINVRI
ncbi:hypothetical protein, partial [Phyllobacterium myrsinacearum]|uniref:hypothetical protein n=1 Tax=Phyllobacterium myrsinacearum TaxID=28101 RepID=UPI001FEE4059